MPGRFDSTKKKAVEKALAELQADIQKALEGVEKKRIGDFEVVQANTEELRALHAKQAELTKLCNRLQGVVEDVESGAVGGHAKSASPRGNTIRQILGSDNLKEWREKSILRATPYSIPVEKGTLIRGRKSVDSDFTFDDPNNPGVVKPWYKPEIVDLRQAAVRVFDLFPRIPVDSNSVEYDKETAEFPWVGRLTADILAAATSIPLNTVIGLGTTAPYNQITLDDGTNSETLTISAIDSATNTVTTNAAANAYAAADTKVTAQYFQCTPESQLKPRASHTITPIQKSVCTMAVWEDASVQVLMDDNRLERFLRLKLMDLVARKSETAIFYGDGVGSNIRGIWVDPEVPQFLWSGGVAGSSRSQHLLRTAFEVIRQNYTPTDVLLAPGDLLEIFLETDDENAYLFIRDLSQPMPSNFFGLTITWSNQLRYQEGANVGGDFLVGDFDAFAVIYDRESMSLQIGTKNDDFVKNRRTMLAEMRFAFCIERPLAAARGTFDTAP